MDLEEKLSGIIKRLDLGEWQVIWEPDSTQPRGQIQLDSRIILIHNEKPEDAIETLLHEALELKLRPMLKPYRTLVNSLIEWADGQVYEAKEKTIEDILQLVKFNEEEHASQKNLEEVSDG